jgi:hypothetical protein
MEHRFRDAMISADFSNWNTTSMRRMFAYTIQFNSDISDLDTSYITGGAYMTWETTQFNQDLSRSDVTLVVYTDDMNSGLKQIMSMDAHAFNQDCVPGEPNSIRQTISRPCVPAVAAPSKRVQISLTLTR